MSKYNKLLIILTLLFAFSLAGCGSSNNGYIPQEEEEEEEETKISLKKAYNGQLLGVEDKRLYEYLALTNENEIARFLYENKPNGKVNFQTELPISFEWTGGGGPFQIDFAKDEKFANITNTFTAQYHFLDIDTSIFYPNTKYYYRIIDRDGYYTTDSFITKNSPMIWNVDGTKNIRDLGGWLTLDGYKVKFNMLYRGANVDNLTNKGKNTFVNEMKVKTDLDLRGALTSEKDLINNIIKSGKSPSGCENFINAQVNTYNDITTWPQTQNTVYKIAFEALAEPTNYPIYFHCTHGADRTGTLAFLIGGLLGVSYEDLTRDFELTSFYYTTARWRSNIYEERGVYYFTEDGKQQSDVRWGPLHDDLMSTWNVDGTLKSAVENYIINGLGLSSNQVNTIRDLLLEK